MSSQSFSSSSVIVFVLVCLGSTGAFFAPFLHEAASAPLDTDVIAAARARRTANAIAASPEILQHSGNQEMLVDYHNANASTMSSMFMMELYESIYTGHNLISPSPQEFLAIQAADTVRSFNGHLNGSEDTSSDSITWSTSFPTFEHPSSDTVHLAELRVQLNVSRDASTVFVLDVQQWISVPCDYGTEGECRTRRLLHSRNIHAHHSDFDGREVFDITGVVKRWIADQRDTTTPTPEYSLELRTRPYVEQLPGTGRDKEVLKALLAADNVKDNVVIEVEQDSFSSSSYSASSSSSFEEEESLFQVDVQDVTLVVFSRALETPILLADADNSVLTPSRRRRSTEEERRRKKQKEHRKYQKEQQKDKLTEKLRLEKEQHGPCRKVDMEVDFGRIGWDEWIIYPKQFNAFRCVGTCSGPLDSSDNPSNHAIMQDLIRLHQPERRTPAPCCVPTKLLPLSMLYFEEGSVLVRHHESMVVDECGCR